MWRIKKMLFVLALMLSTISVYSQFAGGDGTEGNPYQVSTAAELDSVRAYADANFILMNDIDLTDYLTDGNPGYNTGAFWEPIGNDTDRFTGDFNGNDLKISGLKINRPAQDNIGLFGSIDTGMIYDLSVEIDTVSEVKGNVYTGGLAGKSINSSIINCRITGSVTGNYNVGGLVGWNQESTVTDSRSLTYTTGNNQTGGLIGVNSSGIVTNCHSNVTVTSSGVMSGGLIGQQYNGEITQCSSAGTVNSTFSECGGLIGWAEYFTISKCFTSVNVNIDGSFCSSIGGFVGSANGSLESISDCYATGNVLTNCSGVVGGFAGYLNCSVSRCYSIGQVTGTGQIGGFIGDSAAGSSTGPDCYWDIEKSGVSASEGGVGKTTAEMQSVATYTGWDFTTTPIWAINEYLNDGYPYFNWDKNFHFAGGNGRPDNPFLIATPDHLNNVRNGMYANFRQTADIDLGVSPWKDGKGWNPIGYYNSDTDYGPFRGIYDGNVFIITNLTINRPLSHSTGLFGYIYQSTITNFNLQGVNVVGGIENTGALAGIVNNGNVFNSVSNGSVSGGKFTGGLVGYNNSGSTIENCSTYGAVSATGEYTGGLVGNNYGGAIINLCFTSTVVEGGAYTGGFAGTNSWNSEISNSCSIGTVTGGEGSGGFVGFSAYASTINRCFSTCDVTSTGTNAGGFSGYVFDSTQINDCYSRGNVHGDINVGGFIGYNHTSALTNCYSTGTVSAVTGPAGGFVALAFESNITASYWDQESSGVPGSAGAEGKTTDDMTYLFGANTYEGWNFDTIWVGSYNNNDAYPHLAWQGLTGIEEESSLPKVTALHQNYPNPFNPTTEIKFDLNKDSDVSLSVYNSNGQLVKELVKDNLSAGYHNVTFDAAGLNSGLYFYRLNYGDKAITRKMILVK